jgi:hypothetical protein
MSRLSNLSTIKIGIFKSWNASWYDKIYYASLLFNDLKVRDYLTGLFYKLKIISDYIYLYRLLNNNIVIKTNLIFFSNLRFKTISLKKVYHLDEHFIFFYKKKMWNRFLLNFNLFTQFLYELLYIEYINPKTGKFRRKLIFPLYITSQWFLHFNLLGIKQFINLIKSYFYILSCFSFVFFSFCYSFFSFLNVRSCSHIIRSKLSILVNNLNVTGYSLFNTLILHSSMDICMTTSDNYLMAEWFFHSYLLTIRFHLLMLVKYIYYLVYIVPVSLDIPVFLNISLFKSMDRINICFRLQNMYAYTNEFLFVRKDITKALFITFRSKIEKSISLFEQQNVYFNVSISFKKNPFITSAKLVSDALVYLLQSGRKMVQSFFFIKNWQASLYAMRRRLEYLSYQNISKRILNVNYLFYYATKRSPVIGIRIECSGTFKKGRMSRVYFYTSWIKNDLLTGKMPNNTLIADIDYYQYFAITKGSSIGIKTWIFLETHIYNNNHKYISLVY